MLATVVAPNWKTLYLKVLRIGVGKEGCEGRGRERKMGVCLSCVVVSHRGIAETGSLQEYSAGRKRMAKRERARFSSPVFDARRT